MPCVIIVGGATDDFGSPTAAVETKVQLPIYHVETQEVDVFGIRHIEQQAILPRRLETQSKLGPGKRRSNNRL